MPRKIHHDRIARTILLPSDLWPELQRIADREERSVNGQITYILQAAVRAYDWPDSASPVRKLA